jgi:integrase
MRGDGRIFKRKESKAYWIAFYRNGKEIRESAKTESLKQAEKYLRERIAEVRMEARGLHIFIGTAQNRVRINDLLDALVRDHEIRGKATKKFHSHLKPVRSVFGDMLAVNVMEETIDHVIADWQRERRSPGTINRELGMLGQAYRLAVSRKKLTAAPIIRQLPATMPRQGFFERNEFDSVIQHLPPVLADFSMFGFLTGWRKGEIASLRWEDVDLKGQIIRLRSENSKNGEPRIMGLEGKLLEVIQRREAFRETITDQGVKVHAHIFHQDGKPIGEFRRAWLAACKKAKVDGKLFHDLRRTAVRNMIRAGVSEGVAMKISGHKTRSIFDRYNVVSEKDLVEAAQKISEYNPK